MKMGIIMSLVQFIRLERKSTGSWITFRLPQEMPIRYAAVFINDQMPGWEIISACEENTDGSATFVDNPHPLDDE